MYSKNAYKDSKYYKEKPNACWYYSLRYKQLSIFYISKKKVLYLKTKKQWNWYLCHWEMICKLVHIANLLINLKISKRKWSKTPKQALALVSDPIMSIIENLYFYPQKNWCLLFYLFLTFLYATAKSEDWKWMW